MWSLHDDGHGADKIENGKVRVRILSDCRGVRYHKYDDNFQQVDTGVLISVKHGMEKFNDA